MLDNLPLATLGAFALTSLLIELTPGPNMTWLAVVSLGEGRRTGLAAVGGVALGLALIGLAAAFGLTRIVSGVPLLYESLRIGGTAFLLWLAWDGWRGSREDAPRMTVTPAAGFRRGLATNLLNPKAAAFYIAVLPGFTNPAAPLLPQVLSLTAVYVAVATAIHAAIVLAAAQARPILEHSGRERMVRRTLAVLLAGVALWFLVSTAS